MNEFGLIQRFFVDDWPTSSSVRQSVGDDAAIMSVSAGHELVSSVDTLVEGVHFLPSIDPSDLGFHLVAVNLSDFAAMGATPRWMTLSLSVENAETGWFEAFARGMREAAAQDDVVLVGGDTTRSPLATLTLQLLGEVPSGKALLRSGAKTGDGIYVTGHPGEAAAGLETAIRGEAIPDLYRSFTRPVSRVGFAEGLRGGASAAIDISDGLYADLRKLLEASGLGARLDIDRLPLSDALLDYVDREEAVAFALSGGEDFELLFTAADAPGVDASLPVTRIGTVEAEAGIRCVAAGAPYVYDDDGYMHFK